MFDLWSEFENANNKLSCLVTEKNVELLIKNGTDVNIADKHGTTALMAAAKIGNLESSPQLMHMTFYVKARVIKCIK